MIPLTTIDLWLSCFDVLSVAKNDSDHVDSTSSIYNYRINFWCNFETCQLAGSGARYIMRMHRHMHAAKLLKSYLKN